MDWEKKIHGINQSYLLFLHEFRKSSTLIKVASERLRLTQWVQGASPYRACAGSLGESLHKDGAYRLC